MKIWLKRIGIALGALVIVLVITGFVVYGVGGSRIARPIMVTPEALTVPADSASIARGEHLATAIAKCTDCHTHDLGGQIMADDPAFGRLVSMNLTRGKGGVGGTLTDADFVRAIRHGVAPDGRKLVIMPAANYYYLNDADLGAIIAYVKSRPPVDRELPPSALRFIGRALYVTGKAPLYDADRIDHTGPRPVPVPMGVTKEYGAYQVQVGGCTGCHGPGLSGGPTAGGPPGAPPAANLTPTGIGRYTQADFTRALRTGKRPDGSSLNEFMPWKFTKDMTDDEITAVWLYLQTVPPKPFGGH